MINFVIGRRTKLTQSETKKLIMPLIEQFKSNVCLKIFTADQFDIRGRLTQLIKNKFVFCFKSMVHQFALIVMLLSHFSADTITIVREIFNTETCKS